MLRVLMQLALHLVDSGCSAGSHSWQSDAEFGHCQLRRDECQDGAHSEGVS